MVNPWTDRAFGAQKIYLQDPSSTKIDATEAGVFIVCSTGDPDYFHIVEAVKVPMTREEELDLAAVLLWRNSVFANK